MRILPLQKQGASASKYITGCASNRQALFSIFFRKPPKTLSSLPSESSAGRKTVSAHGLASVEAYDHTRSPRRSAVRRPETLA